MFNFKTNLDELEYRSKFVNKICKLLYDKCNGDLNKAINCDSQIFNDIEENVRNIYQFVETEIPLFAYYRLMKYGADDYGLSQSEYEEAITNTINACLLYYGNKP
jgi:hypothetical protein